MNKKYDIYINSKKTTHVDTLTIFLSIRIHQKSLKIETRLKVSCKKSNLQIQSHRNHFPVQSTSSISQKQSLGLISWFNLLVQLLGSIS